LTVTESGLTLKPLFETISLCHPSSNLLVNFDRPQVLTSTLDSQCLMVTHFCPTLQLLKLISKSFGHVDFIKI
jgi:hypothetical protein